MSTLDAVPAKSSSPTFVRGLYDAVRADWLAYVVALAAPCVVFWLHLLLGLTTVLSIQVLAAHIHGNLRGFELFLVGVILSAYLGGLGPGLLSTFVAAGLMVRYLLPPLHRWYVASTVDLWWLVAFVATGALASFLIEGQHRKKRQRLASHRLRDVTLASIGDAVITTDEAGNNTFLNSKAEQLTGWTNHQAVGRPHSDVFLVINEATREPAEDPVKKILSLGAATRLNNHTLLVSRSGREIPISARAAPLMPPDGRLEGVVLIFRDVSESRKAEAESQRRLQLQEQIAHIVNAAPAVIYSFRQRADGTTCVPFASPWVEEVLGASIEELAKDGALAFSRIHPDDLAHVLATIEESARNLSVWQCEFRVSIPARGEMWMEGRSVPERETDGGTLWYGFMNDITERKRVEQRLQLLTAALESAANAIVLTDSSGNIIWTNAAFTTMTGYTADEALGQNTRILKSGVQPQSFYKAMWDTLQKGHTWRGEVVNQRKDATLYTEEMTITPVSDERGGIAHFIAIKQDVTQQRTLERQLRQSQKMEAIGQLAGGIAHDFNNVLAVILGNSEVLEEQIDSSDPRRIGIGQIRQAATHAASLTSQLLAFSRQQVVQAVVLDLNAVVSNLEKMLRRIIREDIVIVTNLAPNLHCVKADPLQIEQVLMNLAVNARDAMTKGGRLSIETRNVSVTDDMAAAHPGMVSGDYVVLAVSDTGIGMDNELQAHIFEPFFTTKETGQDTGLGLATVYGIVKQNGGYVEVNSQPGRGSTFKVYLPRIEGKVEPKTVEESKSLASGFETVLVVEDSVPLLELLRGFLEAEGYTVLYSEDPQEAIRIAQQRDGPISLLITDVVMPAMSGRDLAERLTAMSPPMKVLYMSGYAADTVIQAGLPDSGPGFLQKPFTRNALLSKVRDALDS